MKLIFATNNSHKILEFRKAVGSRLEIISLADAGIVQDIPEPFDTLKENAQGKAQVIYKLTGGQNCFSEDTGLEVDFLNGRPGVHSARYAGEPVSYFKNTQKLLVEMGHTNLRHARFVTIICLILDGKEYFFEGRCEGHILAEPTGTAGFGYDPVFVPEGAVKTFAEMNADEKNQYSHRRKAADLLILFLKSNTESASHVQN